MTTEPDILSAISRAGLQKRGTLKEWMIANREAFASKLEGFKPDWPILAKVFADAGLLDQRGNRPTAEATRKTWQRVRKLSKPGPRPRDAPTPTGNAKTAPVHRPPVTAETQPTERAGTGDYRDEVRAMLSKGLQVPKPLDK